MIRFKALLDTITMEKAYVLIGCELGREDEVVTRLREIKGVRRATITYGDYDIVVEVEAPNESQMDKLVTKTIRQLPNIRSTTTVGVIC